MCSPSAKDSSKEKGGTVVEYGTVKALHAIAQRIDFIGIVNRIAPKRNGISVGELTLLMAINRCLDPRAKWTILYVRILPGLSGQSCIVSHLHELIACEEDHWREGGGTPGPFRKPLFAVSAAV